MTPPNSIKVNIQVSFKKLRWRDAIKIRLAGFNNVKHLLEIKIQETDEISEETRLTYLATQDGYFDGQNNYHPWKDKHAGSLVNKKYEPIEQAKVIFYDQVNRETMYTADPRIQTITDSLGNWTCHAIEGKYLIHFWKEGVIDITIEREILGDSESHTEAQPLPQ